MKIIHTADWHLGSVFHRNNRNDEHAHFLGWLLSVLRERQPDALIISGDIFDTANPPASAEKLFFDFIGEASEAVAGLQIVITSGNHDSAGRLEAPASLLRSRNVYIRGLVPRDDEEGEPLFDELILPLSLRTSPEAKVVCFALPFLRPYDYPAGMSPTEGIQWYIGNMLKKFKKSPFKGLPIVVSAHFYAAGAYICNSEHSERLVVGGQDAVDASTLDCGASYVALGHIHKAQQVHTQGSTEVWYAGSALPMSFSEKGYRHGVQWVEIADDGETSVSRIDYSPLRSLISIPAQGAASPSDIFDSISALPKRKKGDDGSEWPYLEIRVEERQPEPSLMNEVAEALKDRAVRFCRMVREAPATSGEKDNGPHDIDALRRISPLDMAQTVFESRYHAPMPQALEERFKQAQQKAVEEPQLAE